MRQCAFLRSTSLSPFILLLGLTIGPPALGSVTTTFDVGLEGWTVTGDNASAWSGTGGNPGGCLKVNDLVTGDMNYAVAPLAFHGDWSALDGTGTLSAEIYEDRTSGSWIAPAYIFRIAGPGGAARALSGSAYLPLDGTWNLYSVPLTAAEWVLERGTWSDLLANVNSLTILAEFVTGPEDTRLDNIQLSGTPVPVLTNCVNEGFDVPGLGDWSFQGTGGLTNPGSDGDSGGGGYCRVSDLSGALSYAFAPPAFLGDWSWLDNTGRLSIALRILSAAGNNVGATEFIRLSGPGGSASVSLAPGDLPLPPRLWKTFTFPIQAAAWTVTSGTWAGLLAEVTECRIQLEFFDGTEVVGFDNFARLASDCPDPGPSITVTDPTIGECGHSSLLGASSVALNPLDGNLYGVVDTTPVSGGGLWCVTGSGAGTLLQAYDRPAHLVFDPAGNAYVSEDNAGIIFRRSVAGLSEIWVDGMHTGDDDPCGLCIAPPGFDGPNVAAGDMLVTDWGNSGPDEVWSFPTSAAGGERRVLADPGNVDFFDISPGPGVTYLTDALNADALSILAPSGTLSQRSLSSPLANLSSVVWDQQADRLYVAGQGASGVYGVDPADGTTWQVAGGFVNLAVCCLEIDVTGRRLFVADLGANRLWTLCLPTGSDVGTQTVKAGPGELRVSPNPTRGGAVMVFRLPQVATVGIEVFDITGRLVRRLPLGRMAAQEHVVAWDGLDARALPVSPGIYLVRLGGDGSAARTARVTVVR
jgi:hypothetical protein